MMQLSLKNDHSSLCYNVIITHQNFKIEKYGDFSCDIDYNSRTDVFRDTSALRLLAQRGWRTLCVRRRLPSVA